VRGGKNEEFHRVGTADNASSGIGAPSGWPPEPDVGRMVDGVAFGMDRLKALGNGQVPACAAAAWRILNAP
jgi:DNA (cytosine-5)-methyltransferase 1